MSTTIIRESDSAHPGWREIIIDHDGDAYRLLTIDEPGEPRTHVGPAHIVNGKWTPAPGGVKVFSCILTPKAAGEILTHLRSARSCGFDEGAVAVRAEIRKALGCR